MEINRTGINLTPMDIQAPAGKEETAPALPLEQFSRAQADNPGVIRKMSSILNIKPLDKRGKEFRVQSHATSPEGITYISYRSTRPSKDEGAPENTGYISAVSPQGEILWESGVEEEGLSELKTGPDGTLFAMTKNHLKAINPDGLVRFEHTFEEPVRDHLIDSQGNHYFIRESSRELYKLDANGKRVGLPADFAGVKGDEVVQSGPDRLFMREGNTFRELDLKDGIKKNEFTYKDPVESKANFSRSINHFEVDEKGNMRIWINNNTIISSPPLFDEHSGLGFGGFRRFGGCMPHPPMDDNWYSTTTVCEMSLERLGRDGKVLWKAVNLGSSPKEAQLPDGTVIYSDNNVELKDNPDYDPNAGSMNYKPKTASTGKYFIGRVGPAGKKSDEFLKVEGSVRKIMVDGETGHFLICHGENIVSEFTAKGELVRSRAVPGGEKNLEVDGPAGKNIIVFQQNYGEKAFGLDMESGTFMPFTDNDKDYSYKVIGKEMEQEEDRAGKEDRDDIKVFDGWVDVGGVKLEQNPEKQGKWGGKWGTAT